VGDPMVVARHFRKLKGEQKPIDVKTSILL